MITYKAVKSVFARLVVFAATWLVLTAGSLDEWPLALIVIVAATIASMRLWPERTWRLSLFGVMRFVPFFLAQSLLGGWDVARRALRPSMPLNPGFVDHVFQTDSEASRVLFVWIVSLVPGTASTRMLGGELTVHVLDHLEAPEEKLRMLETYVADLFIEKKA